MSLIKCYETRLISRNASSKLVTAYGKPSDLIEHVIVILTDENGMKGYGEATPLKEFTGETPASIQLILERELLPKLIGVDCFDIAAAHGIMDGAIYGNTSAKAAVDMTLYDLAAKVLGVPEYKLMGGACRKTVGVNRHIGINTVAEAVKMAESYVAQSYKTIKIKVGNDADKDIKRIKAIRKAVGKSINLRIDANQGYTFGTALRVLNALGDEKLEYCEQPLAAWDIAGLKKLRESTCVPIGADESLHSVQDAIIMAENHSVDVFVLKPIKTGGIWPALQIAGIAEAVGIKCVVTSTFDTQIGAAHCLQLASALKTATISCDLTCYASQPEMAVTCHTLENGALTLGTDSGCGVSSICEL